MYITHRLNAINAKVETGSAGLLFVGGVVGGFF